MSDGIKTPFLDVEEYTTGASFRMEVKSAAPSFPKPFTFEGTLPKLNSLNAMKNVCRSCYTYTMALDNFCQSSGVGTIWSCGKRRM